MPNIPNLPAWAKTLLTHFGISFASIVATVAWAQTNAVDLYALWGQLNGIIAAVTKFISTATPLALALYGLWRSKPTTRVAEIAADPKAMAEIEKAPATPATTALAEALKR